MYLFQCSVPHKHNIQNDHINRAILTNPDPNWVTWERKPPPPLCCLSFLPSLLLQYSSCPTISAPSLQLRGSGSIGRRLGRIPAWNWIRALQTQKWPNLVHWMTYVQKPPQREQIFWRARLLDSIPNIGRRIVTPQWPDCGCAVLTPGRRGSSVRRRSHRTFSTHFEIFRRRVGIFSLFFLCCFYFLLEVHVKFSSVFYRD